MKNISYFTVVFLLLLGCGSNTPNDDEPPPAAEVFLSVNPSDFSIKAEGGTQTIAVTSNTNWTVSYDAEWCTISSKSGSSGREDVTITVAINETESARSAELTFTAGNVIKKCVVNQQPKPSFVPEGYTLSVGQKDERCLLFGN